MRSSNLKLLSLRWRQRPHLRNASREQVCRTMTERMGNGGHVDFERLMADLKAVLEDGRELLKSSAGTLKRQVSSGASRTNQLAHGNPYLAIGVVFGIGLLVGLTAGGVFTAKKENLDE